MDKRGFPAFSLKPYGLNNGGGNTSVPDTNPAANNEEGEDNSSFSPPISLHLPGYNTPNTANNLGQNSGSGYASSQVFRALSGGQGASMIPKNISPDRYPTVLAQPHHHHTLGEIAETFKESASFRHDGSDHGDSDLGDDDGDSEGDDRDQSTGRWTKHEHELFLEGLKKYGKEWKKVASMVKTRTVVQTRTHAQKYFQKLSKQEYGGVDDDGDGVYSSQPATSSHMTRKHSTRKQTPARRYSPPQDNDDDDTEEEIESSAKILNEAQRWSERGGTIRGSASKKVEEDTENYYPLETEDLLPSYKSPFALDISLNQALARPELPQPSPAARGKRKQAELQAAQMLVGSSSSTNLELEGLKTLSRLRTGEREDIPSSLKKLRGGLSLSIVNPDGMILQEGFDTPGTPWDSQVHALARGGNSSATNLQLISIATPAEQKQFVVKVQRLVRNGDLTGLHELLAAAELADVPVQTLNEDNAANEREKKPEGVLGKALSRLKSTDIPLVAEAIMLDPNLHSPDSILEMVRLLVDYGASVETVDSNGNTCLHFAARQGLERVGKIVISKGCPINAVNKDGDAAVHLAAMAGHGSFLEMLASLGANFHLRNGSALSPIDLAGYSSKDPGEREVLRRLMLSAEPRLRTMILYHQDFLEHSTRRPSDWEGPDRLRSIMTRLRDRKEFPEYEIEISNQFEKADVTLLGRVHSPEYLAFVNDLAKQVQSSSFADASFAETIPFTPQVQRHIMRQNSGEIKNSEICDTSFSSGTLTAARRAAGAVAHAIDLVMLGRNRNVFCAIRPPGHHSGYKGLLNGADSCGFCIFNNVAAGAMHALEEHKCERVAILDLDIHHGNGTEDIVKRYQYPSRLFFFSVHLFDVEPQEHYHFYPGTGVKNDYVHNIINAPIYPIWRNGTAPNTKPGSGEKRARSDSKDFAHPASVLGSSADEAKPSYGREAYRNAIQQKLLPALRAFNPDLILLSMGFDGASGDVGNCRHQAGTPPVRGMDLLPEDFAWATTEIMKIADICCSGRVVSVLEGGYGEYDHQKGTNFKQYSTRNRASSNPNINSNAAGKDSNGNNTLAIGEIDAHAVETVMNRNVLANGVAAHIHRLIDPYGPLRLNKTREAFASSQK